MAILQQKNATTFYQGWYGLCTDGNEECNDFPLVEGSLAAAKKIYPQILKVYEMRGDSLAQIAFDGTTADGLPLHYGSQVLNKLKCGHTYRILLKAGTESVDIPHFTYANSDTDDIKKITSACMDEPTPTPKSTPTPKIVDYSCCDDTDWSVMVVNGQKVGDNNVQIQTEGHLNQSSVLDGKLCWEEIVTAGDNTSYLIELRDDDDTSLGLIYISLTAKYENQKFKYVLNSSEKCFSGPMKNTLELSANVPNIWSPL